MGFIPYADLGTLLFSRGNLGCGVKRLPKTPSITQGMTGALGAFTIFAPPMFGFFFPSASNLRKSKFRNFLAIWHIAQKVEQFGKHSRGVRQIQAKQHQVASSLVGFMVGLS